MQNKSTFDLRHSHDRRRGYDAALLVLVLFGFFVMWLGWELGGFWVAFSFLAFIGELLMAKALWIDPPRLKIARYRERLVAEPQAWLKVVWLSDLHAGGFRSRAWYEKIVEEVAVLKPDLVVFGGDFVVDFVEKVKELEPLRAVRARYGTFYLLGNHDFLDAPDRVREFFDGMGSRNVENKSVVLVHEGREIEIACVADHWYSNPVLPKRDAKMLPRLLLSHEPDVMMDLKEKEFDLVMCGHTHGGQVRLPGVGALLPIPSQLGRAVDCGRKVVNGIPILVSNGLGESDGRLRLGAFPEIVVVEMGI